ncbi:MAG: hypothetical protein NTX63_02760 [Candidatus Peregrinibacteria bacterium]|nr:hypothetical protein [Candidatus Peregrinibacteria bacterium]
MALSLKGFASSVSGKLLTGALTLGAGSAIARSAEAVEITTITKDAAKLCIGSDYAGAISGEKVGWKGTLADGQSTGLTTTDKLVILEQEYNTNDTLIGMHRNFAYTQFPANNDITEGYYLYDVADVNNVAKSLVINSTNYPEYKEFTRIHFIQGATPDQDRMIFFGNEIYVYKSPFDQAGKIKPACKTGPETPEFSYKYSFPAPDVRATGNFIFLLDGPNNPKIQKLVIGQNSITDDKTVTLNGISASGWPWLYNGFVTTKDSNGKATTYLAVRGYNNVILVNTDDITNYKASDATKDIVVEDPAGRFIFKTIDDGAGNYDIYVSDSWANPSTSKKIISGDAEDTIQGNLAYADGYPTPAWVLYKDGKAYLIELTDTATMTFKITETPFDVFTKKYIGGFKACVTLPGQVATVVKTGTPSDAGDASAVEGAVEKDQDAGTTEVDAGSTDATAEVVGTPDAGAEVDAGSTDANDAIDSWVDGKGDMQDIFQDDAAPDAAPDAAAEVDAAKDVAPDQSVQEVDGFTDKDAPEDATKVDVKINPPEVNTNDNGNTGTDDATADADKGPDASGTETKPGVDAGSSDASPTITSTPPAKDPGCNAGANGGSATPVTVAAGTLLAMRMLLARKKEEVEVVAE